MSKFDWLWVTFTVKWSQTFFLQTFFFSQTFLGGDEAICLSGRDVGCTWYMDGMLAVLTQFINYYFLQRVCQWSVVLQDNQANLFVLTGRECPSYDLWSHKLQRFCRVQVYLRFGKFYDNNNVNNHGNNINGSNDTTYLCCVIVTIIRVLVVIVDVASL